METHDIHIDDAGEREHSSESGAVDSEWVETFKAMSTTAVVLGATLIVLSIVHPNLILRNNTPTGGDMGAHVWGPAYLRDVLLPHWRLTGWSMDWYSGLPAYRFYMVVPALAIVLLDVLLPYGIAFKIIVVAGLVAFPWCVHFMGRIARLAYPLPELMVVGATLFLLDESFTIYGGNIASTMAGEFSHSIALAFAMVGLGLFSRGLDDGKHRGWAAIFIALSALSHGIVLLFVFGGAAVMMLLRWDRQRLKFGATTIGCAVLLSAFWVIPFLGGHAFMTDMKYGSEPGGGSFTTMWDMYFPLSTSWDIVLVVLSLAGFAGSWVRKRHFGIWMGVYIVVLMVGVKVAQGGLPVIGLLWNPRILPFLYLLRYMLAAIGVYEIAVYVRRLVALERSPMSVPSAPGTRFATSTLWVFTLFCLVVIGVRYQSLPFAKLTSTATGTKYSWGPVDFPATRAFSDGWARWNFEGYEGKASYGEYHDIVQTMDALGKNPDHGCGRALWENNSELNKYGTTMALMLLPFWTKGCIGSMEGLYFEAAGTTPYHFIAAAALSKQSSNPVRELRYDNNDPVRGVHYMELLGIKYYMAFTPEAVQKADGVEKLTKVATSGPWHIYELADLSLVTPLDAQPVVVNDRPGDRRERWLEIGSSYFQNTNEWSALPVDGGPDEWQRIDVKVDETRQVGREGEPGRQVDVVVPAQTIAKKALDAVTVSNVKIDDESVSFSVDKVGIPILVKVSYFPNWQVKGAKKIQRAAPNMMVVVPTSTNVTMSYEPSNLDQFSYVLTFAGIAWVLWMFRRRFRYGTALPPMNIDDTEPSSVGVNTTDSV
jgi:6-pyruvoyl-tetrahydropterin synthase related domain